MLLEHHCSVEVATYHERVFELIRWLKGRGANINALNEVLWVPFVAPAPSCSPERIAVCKMLLFRSAFCTDALCTAGHALISSQVPFGHPPSPPQHGQTPLHAFLLDENELEIEDRVDVVKELEDLGADLHAQAKVRPRPPLLPSGPQFFTWANAACEDLAPRHGFIDLCPVHPDAQDGSTTLHALFENQWTWTEALPVLQHLIRAGVRPDARRTTVGAR